METTKNLTASSLSAVESPPLPLSPSLHLQHPRSDNTWDVQKRPLLVGCSAFLVAAGADFEVFFSDHHCRKVVELSSLMIEAFGGPKEEGEAVVRTITGSHPDMKGTLTESSLREDSTRQVNYYKLESPTIQQHNVAACCARDELDYTP
ncbi:hypothetical protein OIU85_005079 [Salix viminalis]|uniref:Uncharacterized protein n=1 Tax=Salix viminalis TaxID=40686 RepID=A0A9Q0PTV7_SALVM|nr:hypothetical protein OIU85_005079 [Salix viminalis]